MVKAIWRPLSRAKSRFFLWNKFPKWDLFQVQSCAVKNSRRWGNLESEKKAESTPSDAFQPCSTTEGKDGSVSYICSNRKGLGDFRSQRSVKSIMGQWSDLTLGRWWISTIGNSNFHSTFPNPRSNCSWIRPFQAGLLLVQVKRGPWKLRSMRPHLSI